jgi:hypothetical protein
MKNSIFWDHRKTTQRYIPEDRISQDLIVLAMVAWWKRFVAATTMSLPFH